MTEPGLPSIADRLEQSVRALCADIKGLAETKARTRTETWLRRELVACILSSRVTYRMAEGALANIAAAGLLADNWWIHPREPLFRTLLHAALTAKFSNPPYKHRYRFSNVMADRLANVRDEVASRSLCRIIDDKADVHDIRSQLIRIIPGLGPKQASMFLRNCGVTDQLAILDTHILKYMALLGLVSVAEPLPGSLKKYERLEKSAVTYAASLGYPVGHLDVAVWATMRAAYELRI